jgi:hypothetical protein
VRDTGFRRRTSEVLEMRDESGLLDQGDSCTASGADHLVDVQVDSALRVDRVVADEGTHPMTETAPARTGSDVGTPTP